MVSQKYKEMLNFKSVIREISVYANKRGEEIGYDNVFDYSLGNPSVPAPQAFNDALIDIVKNEDPLKLHGYSESHGIWEVRCAVADSLKKRFNVPYTGDDIFMTSAAAGAIAHAVRAITGIDPASALPDARIALVASRPSITGILISIRIAS